MTPALEVIWHDLECGAYDADLEVWRALAGVAAGPILDVGAGTGRVALDLARRGHDVVALDRDPVLLAALERRAGGLPLETVCADATAFDLGRDFPLVIVPMQTAQILGGARARASFLACLRSHLRAGGHACLAIADTREAVTDELSEPPLPDLREIDGVVYASRPVAVVDEGDAVRIERLREIVDAGGTRTVLDDVVRLDVLAPERLEAEGAAAGFRVLPRLEVPENREYLGSTVVMLGG
jgi:SAM-dependent methyltransferase